MFRDLEHCSRRVFVPWLSRIIIIVIISWTQALPTVITTPDSWLDAACIPREGGCLGSCFRRVHTVIALVLELCQFDQEITEEIQGIGQLFDTIFSFPLPMGRNPREPSLA